MEQSPSGEANWFSASQEIPGILWNPKGHYHIHQCPLPVLILIQRISPGPRHLYPFHGKASLYGEELLALPPNTQAGRPHFIGCPRLLIPYIRSYPPYWRPFLHPKPEDAPCRGDRDPLIRHSADSNPPFVIPSLSRSINSIPKVSVGCLCVSVSLLC